SLALPARVRHHLRVLAALDPVRGRAERIPPRVAAHEHLVERVALVVADAHHVAGLLDPPRDVAADDVARDVLVVALFWRRGDEAAAAQGQDVLAVARRGDALLAGDAVERHPDVGDRLRGRDRERRRAAGLLIGAVAGAHVTGGQQNVVGLAELRAVLERDRGRLVRLRAEADPLQLGHHTVQVVTRAKDAPLP